MRAAWGEVAQHITHDLRTVPIDREDLRVLVGHGDARGERDELVGEEGGARVEGLRRLAREGGVRAPRSSDSALIHTKPVYECFSSMSMLVWASFTGIPSSTHPWCWTGNCA